MQPIRLLPVDSVQTEWLGGHTNVVPDAQGGWVGCLAQAQTDVGVVGRVPRPRCRGEGAPLCDTHTIEKHSRYPKL